MINHSNNPSKASPLFSKLVMATLMASALAACGGSSDKENRVSGMLVTPLSAKQVAAKLFSPEQVLTKSEACPDVPVGYSPLVAATVSFLDESNQVSSTTTTGSCGEFSAAVEKSVTQVKAETTGNRDIVVNVDVFQQSATGIASAVPAAAEYQIASIQLTDSNKLAFTITDSVTNKAVIGIPASALSVKVNQAQADISSLQSAGATADAASVGLVMDASPSMRAEVKDSDDNILKDANDNPYSRFRMSALAAHTYLDNVTAGDETAMVIFDGNVSFINDASLASLYNFRNAARESATYTFSEDGFTTEPTSLRFIVDLYNPSSKVYTSGNRYDDIHQDSSALTSPYSYPWTGYTAVYDAISTGLEKVSARTNTRKIVIAMSDGEDNSSSESEQSVIDDAKAKGIPVYTIAYGQVSGYYGEADEASMRKIATDTNATFYKVQGADLADAFQSIQTGITFQYIAGLKNAVAVGDTVELSLNYNGVTATRILQR